MKHRFEIAGIVIFIAALVTSACARQEGTTESTAGSTSVTTAETSATTPMDAAPSATAGTAATAGALTDEDRTFMEKAAAGGRFEVSAGTAVSPKAKKPDVKAFADRMVSDHSKASAELEQLAATKGVTLPADMDAEHKQKLQTIVSASDVDKAYMEEMARDHDKVVAEFESAAQKTQDPDLKAWIEKTLPALKDHQKSAHSIAHGK